MARISGVNLPNKPVAIALTYIYGIGRTTAVKICEQASVEGTLQECHVQEILEPSPHLNAAMEVGITHPRNKLFGNSTDV